MTITLNHWCKLATRTIILVNVNLIDKLLKVTLLFKINTYTCITNNHYDC
ncbi:hypothetical protein MAR_006371 [Mya arenaria]|uniref:Uncharacterized protein n=1 Tax=Mya arenaria TaxID=6604 RepID=A0ABY7DB08_MYAAR|nr:hypothetical protein MAR_006371 [Mya arenaria]